MTQLRDKCVLITGGASGIGRIMGRMALEKGARRLAVWDIDQAHIDQTLAAYGAPDRARGYRVDVADCAAVAEAYAHTLRECGPVDLLINCAGIITGNKTFDKLSEEEIVRTLAVNAAGPMVLSLHVLPDMIARNTGHICNIASAAGMISNPRISVYAASKWAVIGWSDSVRIELHEAHSGVRITTVAPYYIGTGMFGGITSRFVPILDPEKTARKILRAVERNRTFRGIPWNYHLIRLIQGLLPAVVFDSLVGRGLGIYAAMDHFTGRKQPHA